MPSKLYWVIFWAMWRTRGIVIRQVANGCFQFNSLRSVTHHQLCRMDQDLEEMYEERVRGMDPAECEVLYGRAGYLSALLFASKYTAGRRAPKKEIVQV